MCFRVVEKPSAGRFQNSIEPHTPEIIRLAVLQCGGFDRHQTKGQEPPFTPTAMQREHCETASRHPLFDGSFI
jgi:hypothetical protein